MLGQNKVLYKIKESDGIFICNIKLYYHLERKEKKNIKKMEESSGSENLDSSYSEVESKLNTLFLICLLYTSPSPRDRG